MAGLRGQLLDLACEAHMLADTGGVGRRQQGQNRPVLGGGCDHLVAVALHPTVMLAEGSGAVAIHAVQALGGALGLTSGV